MNFGPEERKNYKTVLCVCAAGISRSPTTAWVLGHAPYHFNTRSAGVDEGALIPVTQALVEWADEIFVMKKRHEKKLLHRFQVHPDKTVHVLNIDDFYSYRDPDLVDLVRSRCHVLGIK